MAERYSELSQPSTMDLLTKKKLTQPAFTCTKLKLETLEQGVKYVQS